MGTAGSKRERGGVVLQQSVLLDGGCLVVLIVASVDAGRALVMDGLLALL